MIVQTSDSQDISIHAPVKGATLSADSTDDGT